MSEQATFKVGAKVWARYGYNWYRCRVLAVKGNLLLIKYPRLSLGGKELVLASEVIPL